MRAPLPAVVAEAVGRCAAPAAAQTVLERLLEDRPDAVDVLVAEGGPSPALQAAVAVAAASNVLGRLIVSDPGALGVLAALDTAVAVDGTDPDRLVRSQRLALLRVAARDLTGHDGLEEVGEALAALAAGVLDAAVHLADGGGPGLAVIGMGKLGGAELNYASDVDVVFATDPGRGEDGPRKLMALARRTFRVDADLRPEGRAGPLARTVDGYRAYWARWARPWEFQALLKARPVAGDPRLGRAFADAAAEALWTRTFSAEELAEVRAMKARAEALVARRGLAGRELKRGPGGIRDIEFAVQLLQLVHGRLDPALRPKGTLAALEQLVAAGYVDRADGAVLADAYRFLRTVEHRLQLVEEEQVHAVPAGGPALERLARVLGFGDGPGGASAHFTERLRAQLAAVRSVHERLFFRPLLEAFSALPGDRSMPAAAVESRLAAFGFADAARTRQAVDELAGGLTRSSRLMAQLLPLLLNWLSLGPDPDLGLLGLRDLARHPHQRSILLTTFRESPEAARRTCLLLSSSRLLVDAFRQNPELIGRLDDDAALEPGSAAAVAAEAAARLAARSDDDHRRDQLRRLHQDRLVRVAARDLLDRDDLAVVGRSLAEVATGLLQAALAAVAGDTPVAVVGLGRLGGAELSYASDVDLVLVGPDDRPEEAEQVGERLLALLHGPNPVERVLTVDLALRPEGAQGRLGRSLSAYRRYFERWAQPWERQAMLRARPVAGDPALGAAFMAEVERLVWGRPFDDDDTATIRRLKARMERERIPVREDPQFHLKLGPGSRSDVEWTVQLLQLHHRVPGANTLDALAACTAAGLVDEGDAAALADAYRFCERTRNRWFLVGSLPGAAAPGDALPSAGPGLTHLARSLGTTPAALRDDYRRVTRRARRVVERLFYGLAPP